MQQIVFDEPYEFIPPLHTNFWPSLLHYYLPRYLRKQYGVLSVECRHADRLRESIDAGHGILLAPNHCRLSDPLVLGVLSRQVNRHLFAMASWHLFKQDWFTTFLIRRLGAFSIYREGMDRKAINAAISILESAERPLIVFPEGGISRHNDELMALMEGTVVIARNAARRRAKNGGKGQVVIHPIAIRYFFQGDLAATIEPVLSDIEHRLSWQSQNGVNLVDRIGRVAEALLSLKEIQYFGKSNQGNKYARVQSLIDHILVPLEKQWSIEDIEPSVIGRVKRLRAAILPDMVNGQITDQERETRWRQLADCYLVQQMSHYPEEYVRKDDFVPEHVLETVERFEEDLTDKISLRGPFHAVIEVGEVIVISPKKDRNDKSEPAIQIIEQQLIEMLGRLAKESTDGTLDS